MASWTNSMARTVQWQGDFRTPHHNASNQEESPVLSSEFITYLDTLLHIDRNEDTHIPTTDQALTIQNTNVMHLILFIRQIFSSTCFEYQVLIFRRNSCM